MAVSKTIVVLLLLVAAALHLVASVGKAVEKGAHKETLVSGLLALFEIAAAFAVIAIRL